MPSIFTIDFTPQEANAEQDITNPSSLGLPSSLRSNLAVECSELTGDEDSKPPQPTTPDCTTATMSQTQATSTTETAAKITRVSRPWRVHTVALDGETRR
jgi:hypothetical protein